MIRMMPMVFIAPALLHPIYALIIFVVFVEGIFIIFVEEGGHGAPCFFPEVVFIEVLIPAERSRTSGGKGLDDQGGKEFMVLVRGALEIGPAVGVGDKARAAFVVFKAIAFIGPARMAPVLRAAEFGDFLFGFGAIGVETVDGPGVVDFEGVDGVFGEFLATQGTVIHFREGFGGFDQANVDHGVYDGRVFGRVMQEGFGALFDGDPAMFRVRKVAQDDKADRGIRF